MAAAAADRLFNRSVSAIQKLPIPLPQPTPTNLLARIAQPDPTQNCPALAPRALPDQIQPRPANVPILARAAQPPVVVAPGETNPRHFELYKSLPQTIELTYKAEAIFECPFLSCAR